MMRPMQPTPDELARVRESNSDAKRIARGTADLEGKHYLFEFDSERGGPVKIRLASASGWDGGGREFAGRETLLDGTVLDICECLVIERFGMRLAEAIMNCNPDAHNEIALVRVTEQPDGVVLYERDAEPDNN